MTSARCPPGALLLADGLQWLAIGPGEGARLAPGDAEGAHPPRGCARPRGTGPAYRWLLPSGLQQPASASRLNGGRHSRATATRVAQAAIDDTLAAARLDAIIAPTNGRAWVTDLVQGDDYTGFVSSSSPSAIAGCPSITVPAGHVGPLSVGVPFIGRRWDEARLIGCAYAHEQATRARVPP